MPETITIREVEESDIPRVLDLLKVSLGEAPLLKRTPELYAWKHLENPFGQSIAFLAEVDGVVAGLRTLMRWDLITPQGRTLRCVRAVDTATHPQFTRRGIFRRLTEQAIDKATSAGIDLVFNTPNARSGAGYRSMGWTEVGKIGVMVRPTSLSVRTSGEDALQSPERLLRDPISANDLMVDDRRPLGLRTPRTASYVDWRFTSHPTARYFRVDRGESVAVVRPNIRNSRPELLVVDLFGPKPAEAARQAARQSRASYAAMWFSKGAPERSAGLKAGFVPVPGFAALTLMARPLRALDLDVSDMAAWDLAISDLELL